MNQAILTTIAFTGFVVAFFHAAIPTHWLPFVLTARVQGWHRAKTLGITAIAGGGHVLFTTFLGVLIVAAGIEVSRWTGQVFPWIAGGVLFAFGLFFLIRQATGGHAHLFGSHHHHHDEEHDHHEHDHQNHDHHDHDNHDHVHTPAIPGVTEPRTFAVPRAKVS